MTRAPAIVKRHPAAQGASHSHHIVNSLPHHYPLTLCWPKADSTGHAPAHGWVALDNRGGACHDTAYVVVYTSYRLYHLSPVASIPCRTLPSEVRSLCATHRGGMHDMPAPRCGV